MQHNSLPALAPDRRSRIPTALWVILAGLAAALVAIFVFKVAVGTVITFGLIGLMMFSHLFMHGGHGSHGAHGAHSDQANSRVGDDTQTDQDKTHARHGGCH